MARSFIPDSDFPLESVLRERVQFHGVRPLHRDAPVSCAARRIPVILHMQSTVTGHAYQKTRNGSAKKLIRRWKSYML